MLVTMRNYANGGAVVWCHRQPAVCTFLMQSGSLLTPRTEEREREREREKEKATKVGVKAFFSLRCLSCISPPHFYGLRCDDDAS